MSNRLLVATRKGLFSVERTGGKAAPWTVTGADFIGDNVSMVLPDMRSGRLYAALDHGHFGVKLHRSKGIGEAWAECATPVYPPQPEGQSDTDSMGRPIPWTTVKLWALETGGADQPDLLWCGTLPGGLFRSHDAGATWELVRSLWDVPERKHWIGGGYDVPGIHSICVDPRDSRVVRVAVSVGGIWTTRDGGATWACAYTGMTAAYLPPEQSGQPHMQDPHRLVQCPAEPDRLWVQHHDTIFRSADGGATWHACRNAMPSSFGFAVAVHPKDGSRAWFAPAIKDEKRVPADGRFVVTRTRDGGATFQTLHRGLPQEKAYDLVYRHGLEIDGSGELTLTPNGTHS